MARRQFDQVLLTPAYSYKDAAHYLRLPLSTLRSWFVGQNYSTKGKGRRRFQSVIHPDGTGPSYLSFLNFVEAHVLTAIRREHHVHLQAVRRSLDYVRKHFEWERPLAEGKFETDGVDLFVERLGSYVNVSREGQTEMRELLAARLKRIERNDLGEPLRLYLMTRDTSSESDRHVVVDPRVQFGRPILIGTRVPTAVLADRFKAGDEVELLARDFDVLPSVVEDAIRCELTRLDG
jgi:uncharacterized protein (DUF433 family)